MNKHRKFRAFAKKPHRFSYVTCLIRVINQSVGRDICSDNIFSRATYGLCFGRYVFIARDVYCKYCVELFQSPMVGCYRKQVNNVVHDDFVNIRMVFFLCSSTFLVIRLTAHFGMLLHFNEFFLRQNIIYLCTVCSNEFTTFVFCFG